MFVTSIFLILSVLLQTSQSSSAGRRSDSVQANSATPGSKDLNFENLSTAAESARNEKRDDDAIRLYQQALKLRPDWKEGLWYLSTLQYEKERYIDARDLLRRFVSYEPEAGPAWAMLGLSEFQTREYPRSLDHLQRAMSLGM